jgi:uncharacterized membrane protein YphA (DoxX/SURF4 family)
MALVWFYNGLWLKIVFRDSHHRAIVASVFGSDWRADAGLLAIGAGETLLAIGIASGFAHRVINGLQIILLLAMNVVGILYGGGEIAHPAGLLIQNLPLVCCAVLIIVQGPGYFVLKTRG